MKKILLALSLLAVTGSALAQHHGHGARHHGHNGYHGHWHRGHGGSLNWMVPAIIGGAVIYSTTRPSPIIVQQPVIIQEPPMQIPQGQNCTPWTETQHSDGSITRTRTCTQ
jgi:CubicO group peptidase (beta-lactamase class C family)